MTENLIPLDPDYLSQHCDDDGRIKPESFELRFYYKKPDGTWRDPLIPAYVSQTKTGPFVHCTNHLGYDVKNLYRKADAPPIPVPDCVPVGWWVYKELGVWYATPDKPLLQNGAWIASEDSLIAEALFPELYAWEGLIKDACVQKRDTKSDLEKLEDFLCDTEGMTDEEIREELEEAGVDVDTATKRMRETVDKAYEKKKAELEEPDNDPPKEYDYRLDEDGREVDLSHWPKNEAEASKQFLDFSNKPQETESEPKREPLEVWIPVHSDFGFRKDALFFENITDCCTNAPDCSPRLFREVIPPEVKELPDSVGEWGTVELVEDAITGEMGDETIGFVGLDGKFVSKNS